MNKMKYYTVLGLSLLLAGVSSAAEVRYDFKSGKDVVYEVNIKSDQSTQVQTQSYYLLYHPKAVDAARHQATLNYVWCIKETKTEKEGSVHTQGGFGLQGISKDGLARVEQGRKVIITDKGAMVDTGDVDTDNQQEYALGPAARLLLLPLPDAGQNNWSTSRQITLYSERQDDQGFGRRQTTRVETPADEKVTYTAGEPQNGSLTIQRNYDLATLQKIGDTPVTHLSGNGNYVVDLSSGVIKTYEMNLTYEINQKNITMKVPITLTAKLITSDELAQLQKQAAEDEAKRKEAEAKFKEEHKYDAHDVPDGMEKTEMMGNANGGGPYVRVSPDHKPVIGFRIETSEWFGHKCFRTFYPLFEPTKDKKEKETIVIARDGYAVGAVTVNAKDGVNALCITFMKMTDKGLDTKTVYTTPWYGAPMDKERKRLGGDGRIIYGTFGRQGLNMDALGLLMDAPPADVEEPAATPAPKSTAKPAK